MRNGKDKTQINTHVLSNHAKHPLERHRVQDKNESHATQTDGMDSVSFPLRIWLSCGAYLLRSRTFFNKTDVVLRRDGIEVNHYPIPWRGGKRSRPREMTAVMTQDKHREQRRQHLRSDVCRIRSISNAGFFVGSPIGSSEYLEEVITVPLPKKLPNPASAGVLRNTADSTVAIPSSGRIFNEQHSSHLIDEGCGCSFVPTCEYMSLVALKYSGTNGTFWLFSREDILPRIADGES